ncbi:hypothetical protein [Streptomyces sp. NPDC001880]
MPSYTRRRNSDARFRTSFTLMLCSFLGAGTLLFTAPANAMADSREAVSPASAGNAVHHVAQEALASGLDILMSLAENVHDWG